MTYTAPTEEQKFVLRHVAGIEELSGANGYPDASLETVDAIVEGAGAFAAGEWAPLNRVGDTVGAKWSPEGVTMPPGFFEAYRAYVEGGWGTLTGPAEHGGQGLPLALATIVLENLGAANFAFSLCPMLSAGAVEALVHHGSLEQQQTWLPKLISGEWTGAMNLTEPQAGSDVGALKTRAEPAADGRFRIKGQKIFITFGEHDLADNIVHLVLARLPDAPPGTKGISLFLVPKLRLDGTPNDVRCVSIEHKLGIHASPTCVMAFGDNDSCEGELIGPPQGGMRAMFTMMNNARMNVGLQGVSIAERATQAAVAYARGRVQSARAGGPHRDPVPIIHHPDVRRMLMEARAFNESARALVLWGSLQVDLLRRAQDEETRQQADDLLSLLTPVIKGYLTDKGFEAAVNMQQVFGGHGYIREWGMEQFVRDARIAQIYEGTNGIQALDLVGRKLPKDGGRAIMAFLKLVGEELGEAKGNAELKPLADALEQALEDLQASTMWLMQNGMANPNNAGAAAYPYMTIMGIVSLGLMWLRMGRVSSAALANGAAGDSFHQNKLALANFYAARVLPETVSLRRKIESGAETIMALPADAF